MMIDFATCANCNQTLDQTDAVSPWLGVDGTPFCLQGGYHQATD